MSEPDIVKELDPLFNPKTVAVIGATNNFNKWGFSSFSSALAGSQTVYPVNRREDKIIGHTAYKKVTDIPDDIDLSVFVVPAPSCPAVMEDCVEKGVKAAVIISAGFREVGEEGQKLEDEVLRIARKGGIRFVGPNCMGMWSATSDLRAYMFPLPSKPGPIAFVSQGGNLGGAVVMSAITRGLGFRRYISCGATADIQMEDYMEYFGHDPGVKVILAYIEGLNDGRRFIEKVSEVTKKKPVIVLKPGKEEATVKAISAHSGSLAGTAIMHDTAFNKCGVIQADGPEQMIDIATGFLTLPLPNGRKVAIITGGGSYGVICTEACATHDLDVIELPQEALDRFDKIFPPRWSHGNPVDPAGDRNFIGYLKAPTMLLELDEVDAVIFMGFGSLAGFSSMLTSGGMDSVIPTSMFSNLKGMDKLLEGFTSKLASGEAPDLKAVRPFLSAFGGMLGSSAGDMEEFLVSFTQGMDPSLLGDMLSAFPALLSGDTSQVGDMIEKLDPALSGMIAGWMGKYNKPVLTTTFSETETRIMDGVYTYPTAGKVAIVLSKLAWYKEYKENHGIPFDQFELCEVLNTKLNKNK
ncbi:MAG: CoA-binding protein [Halobacteriota archaeon]|nr:CoA-binding protein [Halobacteriota archaeon]